MMAFRQHIRQLHSTRAVSGRGGRGVARPAWQACLCTPPRKPLTKRKYSSCNPLSCRASAAFSAPDQASISSPDLDWQPRVSVWARLASATVSVLFVCGIMHLTNTLTLSLPRLASAALAAYFLNSTFTSLMLERQYATRMLRAQQLAEPDSRFRQVLGLKVHYKVKASLSSPPLPSTYSLTCYHGFGASAFSWGFVQELLARRLSALVTAHDMPGFGLTQRPTNRRDYLLSFNSKLGRAVNEYELAAHSLIGTTELNRTIHSLSNPSAPSSSPAPPPNPRLKRVILGHSLGAACAVLEAMQHPQDVHALILVSPGIIAPRTPAARHVQLRQIESPLQSPNCEAYVPSVSFSDADGAVQSVEAGSGGLPVGATIKAVVDILKALMLWAIAKVLRLLQPLLLLVLRGAVRSRDFWMKGISSAYYNTDRVTAQVIDGYRRAQLLQGFDTGFLAFFYSRLSPYSNLKELFSEARLPNFEDGNLAVRLSQFVSERKIPVLIVHGKEDKLIPVANSVQLAKMVPGCQLVTMGGCGHVPQEEHPEEFVRIAAGYLEQLPSSSSSSS